MRGTTVLCTHFVGTSTHTVLGLRENVISGSTPLHPASVCISNGAIGLSVQLSRRIFQKSSTSLLLHSFVSTKKVFPLHYYPETTKDI